MDLQRRRMGGSRLFGDPAWHMLIELFIARLDGRLIDKSNAYLASGAPHATGHRWAAKLEADGYIYQKRDTTDARRGYFLIADEAMILVAKWLTTMFETTPSDDL